MSRQEEEDGPLRLEELQRPWNKALRALNALAAGAFVIIGVEVIAKVTIWLLELLGIHVWPWVHLFLAGMVSLLIMGYVAFHNFEFLTEAGIRLRQKLAQFMKEGQERDTMQDEDD